MKQIFGQKIAKHLYRFLFVGIYGIDGYLHFFDYFLSRQSLKPPARSLENRPAANGLTDDEKEPVFPLQPWQPKPGHLQDDPGKNPDIS